MMPTVIARDPFRDSKKMSKVFLLSIAEIEEVLERKKKISDVTRVAATTLSNYARLRSAEIHDRALDVMIANKNIKALPLAEE